MDKQMLPARRTRLRHFLFAALIGAIAVIARAAVQPQLGDALPFVFAFPATVLASLLWGTLPGAFAAVVCAVGVWLPGIAPTIADSQISVQFGWFAVSALVTSMLCGQLRASHSRARSREPTAIAVGSGETPLGAWLRAVLWGAMFLPLSAFVAASWWSLERREAEANATLLHSSDLALRQAERVLSVAQEIAGRADQASQFPQGEMRAREGEIHLRLSDMAVGISSVVNANVWDASGFLLARSDQYPVDRGYSIADRGYFQRLRTTPVPVVISEVMVGRQSGKQVLNVAIRRHAPDGSFNGITSVTLKPSFFVDYYQSLAHDESALATFALIRSDGAILARWPTEGAGGYLAKGSPILGRIAEGSQSGRLTYTEDAGRGTQMIRFSRVSDLPVYVVAGISRAAMLSEWARFVGVLAAILIPTTAGLVYVTWVALRKTRREAAVFLELQTQIQARADAEHRMLEAQKLETLSLVTGSVAHDLNNMLAVITSSLHVHKIRRPDVADDKTLTAISRSVQAGVRLTRQLLSFSKKQALRPEVVNFQTWLPAAEALMRSSLGSMAAWTCAVDADTLPVKVDPGELELALINVVLNAKHAMLKGGTLSVHVSNDDHAPKDAPMVIVCVIDTGEGIPPEVMSKVFEPFFTTRQKGVGSGLGLAQVKGFCIQSGGRVTLESVVGKGTTLCMHLPANLEESAVAFEPRSMVPRTLDARLLLVEDNDDVAKTTEQMLTSSGLRVVRVCSADAALEYLATTDVETDIVLSDIAMPGALNGIGLALELRRLYPTLPVMLNTGYAEQIEEGIANGMRVFQKPVPPDVLLAELSALLHDRSRDG